MNYLLWRKQLRKLYGILKPEQREQLRAISLQRNITSHEEKGEGMMPERTWVLGELTEELQNLLNQYLQEYPFLTNKEIWDALDSVKPM
jgi:hypothetical protein